MDGRMLEEARRLGVRLLSSIPGSNKREICNYLYDKYGMRLSCSRSYGDIWKWQILPYYGLEIMARVSLTEMRKRLPDDDYYSLKKTFEQGRTPSYSEWVKMDRDWKRALLEGEPKGYHVEWQDYGKFFFKYCEYITPPTKEEVTQRNTELMRDLYGIAVLGEEVDEEKERPELIPKSRGRSASSIADGTHKAGVFIVHGRDSSAEYQLKDLLRDWGLEPIILHEQPNRGRAIIEKFEEHSAGVGCAIVLLTPDDEGRQVKTSDWKPRARQNVVFELGYFFAQLGRDKVICLYRSNVELPSDVSGIIYIPFDEDLKREVYSALRRELKAIGFTIRD